MEDNEIIYLRDWMANFDPEAAIAASLEAEITDYYGNQMHKEGVEYVVSHIEFFAKWIGKEFRAGDALVIASA